MAVNTSNTSGFSALNLYKMNLESNKDMDGDAGLPVKPAGNNDYHVRISEQGQQLARAVKSRAEEGKSQPAEQNYNQSVAIGQAETVTRNFAGSTYQTERTRGIMESLVGLFA